MKTLRKGDRGPEVGKLQEKLIAAGYRLKVDEIFWNDTDKAVRQFQTKTGMLPDGIAGPKTLSALGITDNAAASLTASRLRNDLFSVIGAAGLRALSFAKKPLVTEISPSRPASELTISEKGIAFIYTHEAAAGVSNVLHWPKGASGVTLGPGYDMKERSADTIVADMMAIGINRETAQKIAKGAGLSSATNPTAARFVKDNRALVKLKNNQEIDLLRHIVPAYERLVQKAIKVDILQHQFDALVCFAYNPGGRFKSTTDLINQGKIGDAMKKIREAVTSKGEIMPGLVKRREHEVALYLVSDYGKLRTA